MHRKDERGVPSRRSTPPAEAALPDFSGQAEGGGKEDDFETGLGAGADIGDGGGADKDGEPVPLSLAAFGGGMIFS